MYNSSCHNCTCWVNGKFNPTLNMLSGECDTQVQMKWAIQRLNLSWATHHEVKAQNGELSARSGAIGVIMYDKVRHEFEPRLNGPLVLYKLGGPHERNISSGTEQEESEAQHEAQARKHNQQMVMENLIHS
ncbi:hypothetical protein C8J57DRAFT_1241564 [Mycena rebaudengoi]|nr:hypothetical protein C8J57DRAFT_1241564 [Mycena rebaudengoi]